MQPQPAAFKRSDCLLRKRGRKSFVNVTIERALDSREQTTVNVTTTSWHPDQLPHLGQYLLSSSELDVDKAQCIFMWNEVI